MVLCSVLMAQNEIVFNKVSIRFKAGTIEQYLDTIQSQNGVVFVYSDAIQPKNTTSIQEGLYTISQVLDSLFVNQSVMYVTRENLIILSPQNEQSIKSSKVVVMGAVVNQKQMPVPFATVFIENRSLGTIANNEGKFRFVLPANSVSDTLKVSSLGYESQLVYPNQYLTENLVIKLKRASIPLKEVVVRPEDPKYIVRESYDRIKKNYSNRHLIMNAFFREASKQDDDYISLSEALIEIKKSSYSSQLNDLVKLVKGRNGTNTSESELVNLVVEGGLFNGLRLDVVKYDSYFFGKDMLDECYYTLKNRIFINGRQTYVIEFKARENRDYAAYQGKLYIDVESLALVRAEFELSREGLKYSRSLLVKKRPRGYKVKPISAKYVVEYRYYNNVWNLHHARSDLSIRVKKVRGKENKGFSCVFTSSSEFVITGITENPDKKMPFKVVSKSNDVLVEQVAGTEPQYWINENIILPEEPLQNTILRLQEQGELPVSVE